MHSLIFSSFLFFVLLSKVTADSVPELTLHLLPPFLATDLLPPFEDSYKPKAPSAAELSKLNTQLIDAAYEGRVNDVKDALTRGANVNVMENGWNAMLSATRNNHTEIIKILLKNGADVDTPNKDGWAPILIASRYNYLEIVKIILENNGNVNVNETDGWTPLIFASRYNHTEIAKILLDNGANVRSRDKDSWTSLMYASRNGYTEIAKLLLDRGAEVDAAEFDGWTPLIFVSRYGYVEIAKILLAKGANVNAKEVDDWTPIHFVSRYGHLEIANLLLQKPVNVNAKNKKGWTGLIFAARNNHTEIVKALLKKGADINARQTDGWTALHMAAHYNYLDIVKLLLEKGVDTAAKTNYEKSALDYAVEEKNQAIIDILKQGNAIQKMQLTAVELSNLNTQLIDAANKGRVSDVKDALSRGANVNIMQDGWNAMHSATRNNHSEIVKILLQNGADAETPNKDGWAPILIASRYNYLENVKIILEYNGNVNANETDGWTPLIFASRHNHTEIAKVLLDNGANVRSKDHDGWTPLMFASRYGYTEIAKLLLDAGAEVDAAEVDDWTPLIFASRYGHLEIVNLLLQKRANVNAKNDMGWTPLILSSRNNHTEIVKALLENGAEVNATIKSGGWNALHFASQLNYVEIVKLLLEKSIDIGAKNDLGKSALDYAKEGNNQEIIELLEKRIADEKIQAETPVPNLVPILDITNTNDDNLTESDIINSLFNIDPSAVANVEPKLRPAIKACQQYSVLPTGYIYGGHLAELGEFPWMVALVYLNAVNYSISFDCGGTIISESFVLTAAHCMRYRPPSVVRVGKLSLTDEHDNRAINYHIKDIIKHPYWSAVSKKNDIALLRLEKKIEFTDSIIPACLATELIDLPPGTKVTVSGWGSTSNDRFIQSNELRKTQLIAMPLFECNEIFLKYNERAKLPAFENGISVSQFCAHDPVNNSDTCQGDSGGPVQYFPKKDSLAHVVAIVSFGISCGTELPGIYTRVAYYIDWIESIVWPNQ